MRTTSFRTNQDKGGGAGPGILSGLSDIFSTLSSVFPVTGAAPLCEGYPVRSLPPGRADGSASAEQRGAPRSAGRPAAVRGSAGLGLGAGQSELPPGAVGRSGRGAAARGREAGPPLGAAPRWRRRHRSAPGAAGAGRGAMRSVGAAQPPPAPRCRPALWGGAERGSASLRPPPRAALRRRPRPLGDGGAGEARGGRAAVPLLSRAGAGAAAAGPSRRLRYAGRARGAGRETAPGAARPAARRGPRGAGALSNSWPRRRPA